MIHRFLLCLFIFTLFAAAQPEQNYDSSDDSWNWSSSDEGSGGSSYLGVDIADVSPERLSALKLKEEHGAEVTMVDQDAPAGKAGLHEHDVILSLNGTAIESAAQLRRMIKETPPARIVSLGISRDGQLQTIKVQLADRRKSMAWEPNVHVTVPRIPEIPSIPDMDLPVSIVVVHSSARSGLMVENLTSQLAEFFGVKDGNGVLVRSVEKGSLSEKSGFRAGDVVTKVDNQAIHDTSDFAHALRSSSGHAVGVTVMREKREQNLTISLPGKKDSGELQDSSNGYDFTADTEEAIAGDQIAEIGPAMNEVTQWAECWKELENNAEDRHKEIKEQIEERQQQEQELREQQKDMQQKLQHYLQRQLSHGQAEI